MPANYHCARPWGFTIQCDVILMISLSQHMIEKLTTNLLMRYLNIAVLWRPQNVIDQVLLINTLYLKQVWAGLIRLSIVTVAVLTFFMSGLRACEHDFFLDSSEVNNSSATSSGRDESPCWLSYSGPASWSSQLIQNSPKTTLRFSHVCSCLFFVCNRFLKQKISSNSN